MAPLQIGVCSWSLKIPDLEETFATIKNKLDLDLVQIGFWDDSFKDIDRIRKLLDKYGLEASASCLGFEGEDYSSIQRIAATGGYIPDNEWDARFAKTRAFAEFTQAMGLNLLAVHIGFVPHDKNDAKHKVMVDRMKRICDALAKRNVTLVMETGQEEAETLLEFIDEVGMDNIGVNFDPANMILYGVGEPIEAVMQLREKIIHVHMKDATWSDKPREQWGEEVVLGTGDADIPRIVSKLRSGGYEGPLVIEREAGDDRVSDILDGIDLLRNMLG